MNATHELLFSGTEITALAVKNVLEQHNIAYIERNDIQSSINAGIGSADKAVHLFVFNQDKPQAIELIAHLIQ